MAPTPNDEVSWERFLGQKSHLDGEAIVGARSGRVGEGGLDLGILCRLHEAPTDKSRTPGLGWFESCRGEIFFDERPLIGSSDFFGSSAEFLAGDFKGSEPQLWDFRLFHTL